MLQSTDKIYSLVETLNNHRDRYYNQAAPIITDAKYDRLFDELVELEDKTGSKLDKTKALDIPVLSENEFLTMISA